MTPQQKPIDMELNDYLNLIEIEAQKCFYKLKKPTTLEIRDLINEGIVCFYSVYRTYYKTERECPFRNYFHRSLINHFNCILIESYRQSTTEEVDTKDKHSINPFDICRLLDKLKRFKDHELRYIVFLIDLPKEVQQKILDRPRSKHKIVRESLGMTYEQEYKTRKVLVDTLKKKA